jgi:excisionase family DNA binding protein
LFEIRGFWDGTGVTKAIGSVADAVHFSAPTLGRKCRALIHRAMGCIHHAGLSASQAAQVLGVSLGTISRWSDVGYLESFRTERGERRFGQEQIDRFIDLLERQHVGPLIDRQTG